MAHEERPRRVLLVEDDRDLTEVVALHLRSEGFEVGVVHDGDEGVRRFQDGWDLILLDWMLPGRSGLDVLRAIRERDHHTPVLMLTARGEEADKVLGLELGCDDYMTKPFSLRELTARMKVLLRRIELARAIAAGGEQDRVLEYGALRIDNAKRKVTLDGEAVKLTLKEYELLYTLAAKPGRTFSRRQLLDLVWDQDSDVYEHTVNSHVNRLRAKVEHNPNRPRFILTVWGLGYRFTDEF
ncbi:response regulator transcription factor [bacterium]|nr:response regulator transcription factor [bacterium]HPF35425.1 response regulator transcription factor [Candidatus Krumholzibacteria bacterium]HRX51486.1 response regulator transcription factor [Candidatus Krumholzibacteria bacterium]